MRFYPNYFLYPRHVMEVEPRCNLVENCKIKNVQKCQKMGPNFPGPVMLVTKLCNKYKLWQNNLFARRLFPNSCQSTSRYLDKLQNNWDKTEKYAADQVALDLDVRSVDLCNLKNSSTFWPSTFDHNYWTNPPPH